MTEKQPTLDTLEAENFSLEQSLSYQNRKALSKMFHYIHTFPLEMYEIELIRKDILGMAVEAEQRKESIFSVIGQDPTTFCNELLDAIGGIKVPKGRKLLRIAGWYYLILGGIMCVMFGVPVAGIGLAFLNGGEMLGGGYLTFLEVAVTIGYLILAIIWVIAGKLAKRYSGDITKSNNALGWGIGLLAFKIGFPIIYNMTGLAEGAVASAALGAGARLFAGTASLIGYLIPVMYIAGAWMNKRSVER